MISKCPSPPFPCGFMGGVCGKNELHFHCGSVGVSPAGVGKELNLGSQGRENKKNNSRNAKELLILCLGHLGENEMGKFLFALENGSLELQREFLRSC